MSKYLKMADVFPVVIRTDDESGSLICDEDGIILESFSGDKVADYALHAINSHDELVAEVERLTSSLNHANSNHELFERQYYLEKDKCDDMQAEVERLTKSAELAIMTLEEVDRVLTERIKNGAYDLDDISGEVAYALDKISARE